MKIYLVDGTYELFRSHFGAPPRKAPDGREVGATLGLLPSLLAQFPLAEEAVSALGLVIWPMVEFEADDALSSATARFKNEAGVEQIVICSPDKDLAQLVSGSRIVGWDRRR